MQGKIADMYTRLFALDTATLPRVLDRWPIAAPEADS